MNSGSFFKAVIDMVDDGIIAIDSMGLIRVYNKRAMDIFGIMPASGPGHKKGKAVLGDIVLFADNSLGSDDGGLTPEDLKVIGIEPEDIKTGDMVVAIGIKGAQPGTAIFKKEAADKAVRPLQVSTTMAGLKLTAEADPLIKRLRLKVGEEKFDFVYHHSAGHLLLLDPVTHEIKFYQALGYTARREDAKKILMGSEYTGKGPYAAPPLIIGRHINEIHPESPMIKALVDTAEGKTAGLLDMEGEINGIPVRCSVQPIETKGRRAGAVLKVRDVSELKVILEERDLTIKRLESLEKQLKQTEVQEKAFMDIIGCSEKIRGVIHLAKRAAESNSTVLLLGESGTGKGVFAEAIHKASPRKEGPFIYINCASIPENLLESELFGYEKGAFTGALATGKKGKFELADGGTIFLDEIGELSITLQAKLLHVIQRKSFTRVGGLDPINVDVRIIAATNKNLEKAVLEGKFREDLYYRINVISILIPPLRERPEDIFPLVEYFIPRICERAGKKAKRISDQAMKILLDHRWKGNVRELENVLERAVNIAAGDTILSVHLPEYLYHGHASEGSTEELVELKGFAPIDEILKQTEKKAIKKALDIAGGSRKKAMNLLGMGKTSFYKKMKEHNIE